MDSSSLISKRCVMIGKRELEISSVDLVRGTREQETELERRMNGSKLDREVRRIDSYGTKRESLISLRRLSLLRSAKV